MQLKILHYFKNSSDYVSGEEISRNLKISRAAVWKNIEELRKRGYIFDAVPHMGYKLKAIPDKLLTHEIQNGLMTRFVGKNIECYDSISSTMEKAFGLGLEGAEEGTVICAESQTKGKGRRGRSWSSPKGKGIYVSVILRPTLALRDVAKLTLLTGVCVCEAVNTMTNLKSTIKWPNDVLINGRKVAGILTELRAELDQVRFVVVGIGINVNTPLSSLPPQATSIKQEFNKSISRLDLLREVLKRLEELYTEVQVKGFARVLNRWKELSSTLGKTIRIVDQNGEVEGIAVDLDDYGGIVLEDSEGKRVVRMSGDIH